MIDALISLDAKYEEQFSYLIKTVNFFIENDLYFTISILNSKKRIIFSEQLNFFQSSHPFQFFVSQLIFCLI